MAGMYSKKGVERKGGCKELLGMGMHVGKFVHWQFRLSVVPITCLLELLAYVN